MSEVRMKSKGRQMKFGVLGMRWQARRADQPTRVHECYTGNGANLRPTWEQRNA